MSENISNETFKQKYLKYKSKYINLKNELKGGDEIRDYKSFSTYIEILFRFPIKSYNINKKYNMFMVNFDNEEMNEDLKVTFVFNGQTVEITEFNKSADVYRYTADEGKNIKKLVVNLVNETLCRHKNFSNDLSGFLD